MVRKFIVNSGDNNNISDMLIAKSEFSASVHSTDSHEESGKIYCNVEFSNINDFPSLFKNISEVSGHCKDSGWLIAPPVSNNNSNGVNPFI